MNAIVELDRVEQERKTIVKRIKDGIQASEKRQGRPKGKLDKMTKELETDLRKYKTDRNVKAIDIMRKYKISRNTLKKYLEFL